MAEPVKFDILTINIENILSMWSKQNPHLYCFFIFTYEEYIYEELLDLKILTQDEIDLFEDENHLFVAFTSIDKDFVDNMAWKLNDARIMGYTYFNGEPS